MEHCQTLGWVAGTYSVKFSPAEFPKIQILTVEELLTKRQQPKVPILALNYYKEAKAAKETKGNQALDI